MIIFCKDFTVQTCHRLQHNESICKQTLLIREITRQKFTAQTTKIAKRKASLKRKVSNINVNTTTREGAATHVALINSIEFHVKHGRR